MKRIELNNLLQKKDYQTLSLWLRSTNPEIQAYGLEGIYTLSKSGIKPNPKDLEIMVHLIRQPLKIYACNGCVYGHEKEFADIVSPKLIRKLQRRCR